MTWGLLTPFAGHALAHGGSDPFASLQRELNRAFDEAYLGQGRTGTAMPAANILRLDVKEDEKAFHVTADMPGVAESEVQVTYDNGILTIRGDKKVERNEKDGTWHIVERSWGSFARQLSLPTNINSEAIEARFEKGVLTVVLPKKADDQTKAKKIEVRST